MAAAIEFRDRTMQHAACGGWRGRGGSPDPLYKVTITPRGHALGSTHTLPEAARHTLDEAYLRGQLVTLLAGRAAEWPFLGTASSGADDDIRRATETARAMVARWGMTAELGPGDFRQSDDHPFLGQSIARPRAHADATAASIDTAVIALLKSAEAQAGDTLKPYRDRVARLVDALETNETLDIDEICACLDPQSKVIRLTPPAGLSPPDNPAP